MLNLIQALASKKHPFLGGSFTLEFLSPENISKTSTPYLHTQPRHSRHANLSEAVQICRVCRLIGFVGLFGFIGFLGSKSIQAKQPPTDVPAQIVAGSALQNQGLSIGNGKENGDYYLGLRV